MLLLLFVVPVACSAEVLECPEFSGYVYDYADAFRTFCSSMAEAVRTKEAVTMWLKERLRLDVSPEKTKVVNLRKGYSNFLGIKIARGFRSCKKEQESVGLIPHHITSFSRTRRAKKPSLCSKTCKFFVRSSSI